MLCYIPMRLRSARRTPVFQRTAAFALAALVLSHHENLWAAATASIEMGFNGPNQSLPLGEPFVLNGAVTSATSAVHAVFVRTSFHPFGAGASADCKAVRDQLGEPREILENPSQPAKSIKALSVPAHTPPMGIIDHPETYWSGAEASSQPMLMAASWFRKDAGETQYTVRVPGDSSFFRQGARYCMLVYTVGQPAFQSEPLMQGFDTLRASLHQCKDAQCVDTALKRFMAISKEAQRHVDPEHRAKLTALTQRLADTAGLFSLTAQYPFTDLLLRWPFGFKPPAPPPEPPKKPIKPDKPTPADIKAAALRQGFLHASDDPLARFLLIMLERGKDIRLWQQAQGFGYATADGKLKIGFIRLVDAQTAELRDEDLSPESARRLSVRWDLIPLPESPLSVRDMLELAHGKLCTQKGCVRPDEEYGQNSTPEERSDLRKRLALLDGVLKRTLIARLGPSAWQTTAPLSGFEIYQAIGDWLWKDILADCKAWAGSTAFPSPKNINKNPCETQPSGGAPDARWPGFAQEDDSPHALLVQRLENLESAEKALTDIKKDLAELKGARTVDTEVSIGQGISFSRQSFFTQHITPTVGLSVITRPESSISLAYLGAKIYLWPNAVDEPLWIVNDVRADVRRIPAFELGFGLEKTGLGDKGRYSGLFEGAFPPVFFGLSLQLLPYTTLSGGLVLLEARRSTLAQEQTHLFPSPYISIGLDPNLIDFFVSQFSQSRNSAKDISVSIKASNEGGQ